jgi:hypothetical protein
MAMEHILFTIWEIINGTYPMAMEHGNLINMEHIIFAIWGFTMPWLITRG